MLTTGREEFAVVPPAHLLKRTFEDELIVHQLEVSDAQDPISETSGRHDSSAPETPATGPRLATAVLIVDDCTLYRENLAVALASRSDVATDVAWDMWSLLARLEAKEPQVVLLSMTTKESTALLRAVVANTPRAKVIAVGVWEGDESMIVACAEAGVTGYHLRDEPFKDLLRLIDEVANGKSVCSPRVAAVLLRRLSTLATERKHDPGELVLTAREIQILRMLELGLSNSEIANELCIALHTVKNHVHSVLGKLGVSTRAQAVAVSRSTGWTETSIRDLGTEPA